MTSWCDTAQRRDRVIITCQGFPPRVRYEHYSAHFHVVYFSTCFVLVHVLCVSLLLAKYCSVFCRRTFADRLFRVATSRSCSATSFLCVFWVVPVIIVRRSPDLCPFPVPEFDSRLGFVCLSF